MCLSPLVYTLAQEAITYESDIYTFSVVQDAVLVPTSPKIAPRNEVKKKVVQSTTKKQIKGSKFIPPPQEIKVIIEEKANKYGVDPILMKAISFCESDYRANAYNENGNKSNDKGVAQINSLHLPELKKLGLDRSDVSDAYEFMAILLKRNGTNDYKASKECWEVAVKVARN